MAGVYKIGDKLFHVQSRHRAKSDAQKEASWIRKQGKLARVQDNGRGMWEVLMCNRQRKTK